MVNQDNISFTQQIKDELINLPFDETKSKSILSAFIRSNGSLEITHQGMKLVLKTENNKIAKYIYNLIKKLFIGISISFSFRTLMHFNKGTQYILHINTDVDKILSELEIDFLESKIPYNLTDKEIKIKGYLEGLFLSCGTCNNPSSSNYHLEIYTSDEAYSEAIYKLIHKIKEYTFHFKIIKRRNNYVVYLKRSDEISSFLAYLEANICCLNFEGGRVDRDNANSLNRLMNMDQYNYKKTIEKAEQQIGYIKIIDKYFGIKNITNEKLKELCYLRLENKEATYNDLATMLSKKINNNVTKSNINHLFIKIKDMAKGFENEDN